MKKLLMILGIIIVVLLIIWVVIPKGSNNQETVLEQPSQQGPIQCEDPSCFSPHFLTCTPSELKMPFSEGNTYIITVFGVENGKCHYALKMIDQTGALLSGGPGLLDCSVPLEKISADTLGHFFGADQVEGQEGIKAVQDQIEKDYCITQQ